MPANTDDNYIPNSNSGKTVNTGKSQKFLCTFGGGLIRPKLFIDPTYEPSDIIVCNQSVDGSS